MFKFKYVPRKKDKKLQNLLGQQPTLSIFASIRCLPAPRADAGSLRPRHGRPRAYAPKPARLHGRNGLLGGRKEEIKRENPRSLNSNANGGVFQQHLPSKGRPNLQCCQRVASSRVAKEPNSPTMRKNQASHLFQIPFRGERPNLNHLPQPWCPAVFHPSERCTGKGSM